MLFIYNLADLKPFPKKLQQEGSLLTHQVETAIYSISYVYPPASFHAL
jgi:hypothetical protein